MADTQITDPLDRVCILHDVIWNRHILRRHPEMAPHTLLVEDAVMNPLSIWTSKQDADSRFYYGSGPRPNVLVAVICDVAIGVVKTACLSKLMTGENLEWLRPILLKE